MSMKVKTISTSCLLSAILLLSCTSKKSSSLTETEKASGKEMVKENAAKKDLVKFTSIKELMDHLGEYNEEETFKIVSNSPLHIQISPEIIEGDIPSTIEDLVKSSIVFVGVSTMAQTDYGDITITSVPVYFDFQTKKYTRYDDKYKKTAKVTREKVLSILKNEINVTSFGELYGSSYGGVDCDDCPGDKFNRLMYNDKPPGLNRIFNLLSSK